MEQKKKNKSRDEDNISRQVVGDTGVLSDEDEAFTHLLETWSGLVGDDDIPEWEVSYLSRLLIDGWAESDIVCLAEGLLRRGVDIKGSTDQQRTKILELFIARYNQPTHHANGRALFKDAQCRRQFLAELTHELSEKS